MKRLRWHAADLLATAMMRACAVMGHVGYCGLLNRGWTSRLFGWAIRNSPPREVRR